jgi:hypothetical protein
MDVVLRNSSSREVERENTCKTTRQCRPDHCVLALQLCHQRAVYALQDFHSLFQGDISITDYFRHLKQLNNLPYDVGHPVFEPSLVINALCILNFSHTISTITAFKPLPSFLFIRNYLLQDEHRQNHTSKMEAASALMATASTGMGGSKQSHSLVPTPGPSSSLTSSKNNSRK